MSLNEIVIKSIKQFKPVITPEDARAIIVKRLLTFSTCDPAFIEKVKNLPLSSIKKTHECHYGLIAREISFTYYSTSVTMLPYSTIYGYRVTEDQDGNEVDRTPLYTSGQTEYKEKKMVFKEIHGDTVLFTISSFFDRFEAEPVSDSNKEEAKSIASYSTARDALFSAVKKQDYVFRESDAIEDRSVDAEQLIFEFGFAPFWEFVVDGHRFSVNALVGHVASFSFKMNEACQKRCDRLLRDLEKKDRKEEKRWNCFMVFIVILCILMMINAVSLVYLKTVLFKWIMIVAGVILLFIYFIFLVEFITKENMGGNRAETFKKLLKANDYSISLYRQAKKAKAHVRARRTYTFWYLMGTLIYVLTGMIGFIDFGDAVNYLIQFFTFDTPFWHLIFG